MYVAALVLVGMSSFVAAVNGYGVVSARRRGECLSPIPMVSLLLGGAAFLLAPRSPGPWAFVPTALDPATWALLWLPVALLRQRRP